MATAAPAPDLPVHPLLQRLSRERLEWFIEVAITLLDLADPDPDLEDGDEDACPARDDTGTCRFYDGYGDGYPGDPADSEPDDPLEGSRQLLSACSASLD